MSSPQSPRRRFRVHPEDVAPEDLTRLEALHSLLRTLNDPLASQSQIERACGDLPVLAARLRSHARVSVSSKKVFRLSDALRIVGNRGVEIVLMQLLEDLTILKADLEDEQREVNSSGTTTPIGEPSSQPTSEGKRSLGS